MISITVSIDKNGEYKRIEFNGHALFAEYGTDIVCAAVSILALNTLNSIEIFCEDIISVEEDTENGLLAAEFKNKLSEKAKLLMDSLLLGLDGISKEYGKKYVTILRQEV